MPLYTMISAQIRKSFTYFFSRNTSFLKEPHFSSTLAQHFFSTSTKKEGKQKDSNSESLTFFLKELGLSDTQLENMFKQTTQLRAANLEKTIKPKIKVFHDFGFSNSEIAELIARQPKILCCSVRNRMIPSLSFLRDLLGSHDDLFKVLKGFGWFVCRDVKKYVWPSMELFLSYGVPMEHIRWIFRLYPRSMFLTHESLRRRIEKLEALGVEVNPSKKFYVVAFRVIGSMTNKVWEQKMQAFREMGFSETEILDIFKRAPPVFTRDRKKLKKITEMILATKKYSRASIVTYAMVFGCSIEKRLKPRIEVLELLKKLNLIEKWPCFGALSSYSNKRFHDRFVAPYLNQLEEAYALKKSLMITATTAA